MLGESRHTVYNLEYSICQCHCNVGQYALIGAARLRIRGGSWKLFLEVSFSVSQFCLSVRLYLVRSVCVCASLDVRKSILCSSDIHCSVILTSPPHCRGG